MAVVCMCSLVCVRLAVVGEASMSALLSSMLAQMSSARLQSDAAVADLAMIYRNDPLLQSFPIPRVVLDSAVMDLPVRA